MKRYTFPAIVFLLLATPILLAVSEKSLERQIREAPFKGLGKLAVLVENLGPDGDKIGISAEEIKVFVELKLRQSGVPVCQIEDYSLESPYLYVNINLMNLGEVNHYVYSASLSLTQQVRLLRNDTTLSAKTWDKGEVAIMKRNQAHSEIKGSIDSLLTFFLNDYLAANSGLKR